jgi:hypothetical protein
LDFQIVYPLCLEAAVLFLYCAIQWSMDRTEPILENTVYRDVIKDENRRPIPVMFALREETDRSVWRMLLPDIDHKLRQTTKEAYISQADASP